MRFFQQATKLFLKKARPFHKVTSLAFYPLTEMFLPPRHVQPPSRRVSSPPHPPAASADSHYWLCCFCGDTAEAGAHAPKVCCGVGRRQGDCERRGSDRRGRRSYAFRSRLPVSGRIVGRTDHHVYAKRRLSPDQRSPRAKGVVVPCSAGYDHRCSDWDGDVARAERRQGHGDDTASEAAGGS